MCGTVIAIVQRAVQTGTTKNQITQQRFPSYLTPLAKFATTNLLRGKEVYLTIETGYKLLKMVQKILLYCPNIIS